MNNILSNTNKELYISLSAPYLNIKKILSFTDELIFNSIYYTLNKYFRFSFNKINYSNWLELTDFNLQYIDISEKSEFWIEYKYELITIEDNETIEFQNISLEIINYDLKLENLLSTNCIINTGCENSQNSIVGDCCPMNLFNPYDLTNAIKVLNPLVKLVSDIFGFNVEYYKTDPRLNSKDIILNEYSVYNVVSKCNVNILIPDNTLPTKELQFNSAEGIALPDVFEVHIVKSAFEVSFGIGEIPRPKDYLYFPYLKRIYKVNSVIISDENPFNTANYYRVNLIDYVEAINVLDVDDLNFDLNALTTENSYEKKYSEEMNNEIIDVKKPDEYVTLNKGKDGDDMIRKYINPEVIISSHNFINEKTYQVVSNYYYDFTKIVDKIPVIEYNYSNGLPDDFSITFMLNQTKRLLTENININIKKISDSSGSYTDDYYFNGLLVETFEDTDFVDGDIINLKNTSYYNGINIISKVINSKTFIIDKVYKGFNGGSINKKYESQTVLDSENTFSILLIDGHVILKLNNKILIYQYSYLMNKWNFFIINYSNTFKQTSLFIYDNTFNQIYQKVGLIDKTIFNRKPFTIISGSYYLSNIRLFNSIIEDEQHESILSQGIIQDSNLGLIIDNARPQIRLKNYGNNK